MSNLNRDFQNFKTVFIQTELESEFYRDIYIQFPVDEIVVKSFIAAPEAAGLGDEIRLLYTSLIPGEILLGCDSVNTTANTLYSRFRLPSNSTIQGNYKFEWKGLLNTQPEIIGGHLGRIKIYIELLFVQY